MPCRSCSDGEITMMLIKRPAGDTVTVLRSTFGRPLFIGCVVLLAIVVFGSLFGGIYWRYTPSSGGYMLLPVLGFLLAPTCIPIKRVSQGSRILCGRVAATSLLYVV